MNNRENRFIDPRISCHPNERFSALCFQAARAPSFLPPTVYRYALPKLLCCLFGCASGLFKVALPGNLFTLILTFYAPQLILRISGRAASAGTYAFCFIAICCFARRGAAKQAAAVHAGGFPLFEPFYAPSPNLVPSKAADKSLHGRAGNLARADFPSLKTPPWRIFCSAQTSAPLPRATFST